MIRICHLRWGGAELTYASWELRAGEISKLPHTDLTPRSFAKAQAVAAEAEVVVLEIPATPFQEAFFYHRNPFKNAWDLPRSIRLWRHYQRLIQFVKRAGKPFVIFDFQDSCAIPARFLPLIRHAVAYHKRELPRLPANAFLHTEHFAIEPWRNRGRYAAEVEKLRPLSLGALCPVLPPPPNGPRDIDVLWGGTLENSPVRQHGLRMLRELQREEAGLNIVLLEEAVGKSEFQALLCRSKLAFCPDGLGWQCYRTFEAAQLGAVPLLTHPPIWLDQGLCDGEQACYFAPEGDDLKFKVLDILGDLDRLSGMSSAGQAFVRHAHTETAVYERHIRTVVHPLTPPLVPEPDVQ